MIIESTNCQINPTVSSLMRSKPASTADSARSVAAPLLGSASPPPYGHSGFTGTSLVIDPARGLTIILLTNNVHPLRGRPGIRELRHAVASTALKAYHRAGR